MFTTSFRIVRTWSCFWRSQKLHRSFLRYNTRRSQLEVKKDNANGMVSTGFPMTSHSCYRLIRIKTQSTNFSKDFDYFKLAKSLGHSEDKLNMNFDFNKNLIIVKFDELINTQIEKIEKTTELNLITRE